MAYPNNPDRTRRRQSPPIEPKPKRISKRPVPDAPAAPMADVAAPPKKRAPKVPVTKAPALWSYQPTMPLETTVSVTPPPALPAPPVDDVPTAATAPAAVLPIDKNIPIPPSSQYPFAQMEVGDSFYAPNKRPGHFTAYMEKFRRQDLEFTCRTVPGGVRVWRIA
jgi:hypothetical protein